MFCLSYYPYVFSLTKLEIRAGQVLSGRKGVGGRGWGRRLEGEMTHTMYAHVNK
jgi:hypothetical protein